MKIVKIRINNWKKYNDHHQNKLKRAWWLKLSNMIHMDPDFIDLRPEQKWAWVCILCESSLRRSDVLTINLTHHARIWCVSSVLLSETIDKLAEKQILEQLSGRPSPAQIRLDKNRIEKEYIVQPPLDDVSVQIEKIYLEYYPRKEGKTRGVKKLARELRSPDDLAQFETAVKNYASEMKTRKTELVYIKLFSSFASEWRDWIEPVNKRRLIFKEVTPNV